MRESCEDLAGRSVDWADNSPVLLLTDLRICMQIATRTLIASLKAITENYTHLDLT